MIQARNIARPLALITFMFFIASSGSGQTRDGSYVLGPNVQVSLSQPTLQHYETQIAADPRHAAHLIAGAYVINSDGTFDNVFYVSFDHGKTWIHTLALHDAVDPPARLAATAQCSRRVWLR